MSESETVGVPKALLERLLDRVDDLEDELSEYREHNEQDKATIRQDVHEAIEKADTAAEREAAESDDSRASDDSMTPMERLMRFGEDSIVGRATESVERAMAIAENFSRWASKTPKGLVISDGLKNLVETATGERLFWKQIERACLALAKFSKGAIAFKNHSEKGWMLIAQPDDHKYQSLSAPGG